MTPDFPQRVKHAAASIQKLTDFKPQLALAAGTGLASLLSQIKRENTVSYADIADFPVSTAPTHKGELIFGTLGDTRIIALNGRFHAYEGWSMDDIVLPVYLAASLGAGDFIVTNAAGALNREYNVAEAMLIEDHLNFQGASPLTGPNDDSLGPRFPDMSQAYNQTLRNAAIAAASALTIPLQRGIYVAVGGPQFETSAERRFLTLAGGDAVGMSTVPEVIAANHLGMRVLGFSAITNAATGGEEQMPDSLEEVLQNANIAAVAIRAIILEMIANGSFKRSKP